MFDITIVGIRDHALVIDQATRTDGGLVRNSAELRLPSDRSGAFRLAGAASTRRR